MYDLSNYADRLIGRAEQKQLDKLFVEKSGLSIDLLAENASFYLFREILKCAKKYAAVQGKKARILFIAGKGNNGADVIGAFRQALGHAEEFRDSALYLVADKKELSFDFDQVFKQNDGAAASENENCDIKTNNLYESNLLALKACLGEKDYSAITFYSELEKADLSLNFDIIVDGIFGTGYKADREMPQNIAELINLVNKAKKENSSYIISCDIASGLQADNGLAYRDIFVRADLTVSYSGYKKGSFFNQAAELNAAQLIAPISMSKYFIGEALRDFPYAAHFNKSCADVMITREEKSISKHSKCRTAIIGGAAGMQGALALAATSALAARASYLYLFCDKSDEIRKRFPEAIVNDLKDFNGTFTIHDPFVYLIGPGLGTSPEAAKTLKKALASAGGCSNKTVRILDADALNILAADDMIKKLLLERKSEGDITLLTPNRREFKRLAPDLAELLKTDPFKAAGQAAERYGGIILMKGPVTIVAESSSKAYLIDAGTPLLAKAGSGDCLAGLAAALFSDFKLAESPCETAALAAYIHGFVSQKKFHRQFKSGSGFFRIADLPFYIAEYIAAAVSEKGI